MERPLLLAARLLNATARVLVRLDARHQARTAEYDADDMTWDAAALGSYSHAEWSDSATGLWWSGVIHREAVSVPGVATFHVPVIDTEAEHGFTEAPMLADGERPWPIGWETDRVWETCPAHEWERTLVRPASHAAELVVRCRHCHVPRCGHSTDPDPCMLRRHHAVDDSLLLRGHLPLSVLRARGG